MKFSISREALLTPLQLVSGVVERRQTLPILSNLLMVAEDGKLTVTGTDQEVELTVSTVDVEIEEPGEITVPARKLMDICRSLNDAAVITMQMDEHRMAVTSGRFRSHLATLPAIDFPNVESDTADRQLSLPANLLSDLLAKTSFAMAQQDVRYFFNGILIELAGHELRVVATNGQRLAKSQAVLDDDVGQGQYIIPRKGVSELIRILGDSEDNIVLHFSANHLRAELESAVMISKLVDGTYPDYTRAIPMENDKRLVGSRREIREALNRTAILSNEMYRNVRLILSQQKLDIEANNPLQEEAEESVAVDYGGEALEIGFNVSYLLDALSAMQGEQVVIEFSNANSACLLTNPDDSDSLFVVSPMML